jgi:hypothetical protein
MSELGTNHVVDICFNAAQQMCETEPGAGPHCVCTKYRFCRQQGSFEDPSYFGIVGIADVAEDDERIATQPQWIALVDVPRITCFKKFLVGRSEHPHHIDVTTMA